MLKVITQGAFHDYELVAVVETELDLPAEFNTFLGLFDLNGEGFIKHAYEWRLKDEPWCQRVAEALFLSEPAEAREVYAKNPFRAFVAWLRIYRSVRVLEYEEANL